MDYTIESVLEIIRISFPEKTIVDISEVENEDHQTYKYLYESQRINLNKQNEEIHSLAFQVQDLEKELSDLREQLKREKSVNSELANTASNVMDFVKKFTDQEIIVTNVNAISNDEAQTDTSKFEVSSLSESISELPGVYGSKRPSWFSPLSTELSKLNVSRKEVNNTKHILVEKLAFWKNFESKYRKLIPIIEESCKEFDKERRKQICKLLESNCSNQEKYLKYFLLTPGLPKHFLHTLLGAEELGLDANLIIALLEQPKELFNAEIIELYISEAHKGVEFNIKQELAEELIRGEWYVTAEINGISQKYQMVPFELIDDIKKKLDTICLTLGNIADEEVCTNTAQTSSDTNQDVQDINEYIPEFNNDSFLDFDDSLLDDVD